MYCTDCKHTCCTLCSVTKHKHHSTETLSSASHQIRKKIKQFEVSCADTQTELDNKIENLSLQKSTLDGLTVSSKRALTDSVEKCVTALRRREQVLLGMLERDKRLSIEIINRQRERLLSRKSTINKVKKKIQEMQECNDVEVMEREGEIMELCKSHHNLTSKAVLVNAKRMSFEPHNMDSICRAATSLGDRNITISFQTGNSSLTGTLVGNKGKENGKFQYPLGIRVYRGRVYVADAGNNRVQILNSSLQHDMTIAADADGVEFDRPNDVCIDREGMIIIADTFKNSLHWFSQEGEHQRTIAGVFNRPFAVCVNSANDVIVADTGNHRVRVISQGEGGNLVFGKYGKEDGEFDGPHSVAVDKEDNIYVADLYNQRIQVFDSSGTYQKSIGFHLNLQAPRSIAISEGKMYLVDWGYKFVQVMNLKGVLLTQFCVYNERGEEITPNSIAVAPESGIYISDCNNHRVYYVKVNEKPA